MIDIDELVVADPPGAWAAAGFAVDADGVCQIGTVRIRLVGRDNGIGIVGWALHAAPDVLVPDEVDGVPTTRSDAATAAGPTHPNGVVAIDHVVLLSPDLDRTITALADLGLTPRRERDGELGGARIKQVFYRFGGAIVEVIGSPGEANSGPSTLWGLTHVVADIDEAAAFFGENTSRVKDAVQPGRRITTLRNRELGLSVRTALITPHARA